MGHCLRAVFFCSLAVAFAAAQPATRKIDVREYGAKADGLTDDSTAIQGAINRVEHQAGGAVYLPAGTYLVRRTLLVGDNVEIYGDGDRTVLQRSDDPSWVPEYGADCSDRHPPGSKQRHVFHNRAYNCDNSGIKIHDLRIDGSKIRTVPNSALLAFSGIRDSSIRNVTIVDAPQDAIFIRNGGINCRVEQNTILHHNRLWGNGEGINVEMHSNGSDRGILSITGNRVVTDASNFCSSNLAKTCRADSECGPQADSSCGHGSATSAAIGLTWVDGSTPARAVISGNEIEVGNHHFGILCNGCDDTSISNNTIRSVGGQDAWRASFAGINLTSPPSHVVQNVSIESNEIDGANVSSDDRAILVSGEAAGNSRLLLIRHNTIRSKNVDPKLGVIEVRGWEHVELSGNVFENLKGRPILLGVAGWKTDDVQVNGNEFHQVALPPNAKSVEARGSGRVSIK